MATLRAKVTSKGQITLPKALRRTLSINTGDRLEFSVSDANTISVRKQRTAGSSAGCARKFIKLGMKPVSASDMDEGIRQHMMKKYGIKKEAE
jgi:AbrB family looped-hinge helix DNA binding protein